MDHIRFCRYVMLTVFFLAFWHMALVSPCFAKEKKQSDGKNVFSQADIYSDIGDESENEDISLEEMVKDYLCIPYRRGGTGEKGIDCSGLSRKFYMEIYGIDLPHSSREQYKLNIFDKVPLNQDAFEARDLLFFKNRSKRINHVGIYLEDGKFLHASPKKGVMISSLDESYWKKRLVASRRIKDTVLAKASGSKLSLAKDLADGIKSDEISIGYAADINKNLHVDFQTFYSRPQTQAGLRSFDLLSDGLLGVPEFKPGPWQGIRASTDIRPAEWLRLTPSMGMLDGPAWLTGQDEMWKVYGLETAFSPASSRWSLVFTLNSLLNDSYFAAYEDAPDTDIGLHFNYLINDSIALSIMGNREGAYLIRNDDADNLVNDIMSFNLNFSF